jgi:hypothetical protein
MGIKGLFPLLEEKAPHCFRRIDIKVFTGKVIACDASNVDPIDPRLCINSW